MTSPRWPTVVPAVVAAVEAHTDVQTLLDAGLSVFMAGERDFKVNSLECQLISAGIQDELWERTLLQWSIWVRSLDDLVTIEQALDSVLHREIEVTIGGVKLWTQRVGDRSIPGAKDGIVARSVDYRVTYLRGRHVA